MANYVATKLSASPVADNEEDTAEVCDEDFISRVVSMTFNAMGNPRNSFHMHINHATPFHCSIPDDDKISGTPDLCAQ